MSAIWRERRAAVGGGDLAIGVAGPDAAPAALAIHGTTASHRAFTGLARRLPTYSLVAPDLRGRGRSAPLPPPYGLRRHADDLQRVLDALGSDRVTLVGHSLGAFVAVTLADRIPSRVERLVLVDGGMPLALPAEVPLEQHLAAVLGPAAARLRQSFGTREEYHALWRSHPALAGVWGPELEDYVDYDLIGVPPALHSAAVERAVLEDGAELFGPDWYLAALRGLRMPVTVLRAPRDLLDRPGGLYPPGAIEGFRAYVPQLELVEVPDVNHYTVLFEGRGLDAVVSAVTASTPSPLAPTTPHDPKESR